MVPIERIKVNKNRRFLVGGYRLDSLCVGETSVACSPVFIDAVNLSGKTIISCLAQRPLFPRDTSPRCLFVASPSKARAIAISVPPQCFKNSRALIPYLATCPTSSRHRVALCGGLVRHASLLSCCVPLHRFGFDLLNL